MTTGLSLQVEVHPQAALGELGRSAGLIRRCQTKLLGFFDTQLYFFQLATDNFFTKTNFNFKWRLFTVKDVSLNVNEICLLFA